MYQRASQGKNMALGVEDMTLLTLITLNDIRLLSDQLE